MKTPVYGLYQEHYTVVCYWLKDDLVFECSEMDWIESNETLNLKGLYKELLCQKDIDKTIDFVKFLNTNFIPFLTAPKTVIGKDWKGHHVIIFKNNFVNLFIDEQNVLFFQVADIERACKIRTSIPLPLNPKNMFKSKLYSQRGKNQVFFTKQYIVEYLQHTKFMDAEPYVNLTTLITGLGVNIPPLLNANDIQFYKSLFGLPNQVDFFEYWWQSLIHPRIIALV
jgi:hypothetical protein